MQLLVVISFLVGFVAAGCSRSQRDPVSAPQSGPFEPSAGGGDAEGARLAPVTVDAAEKFVNSWCSDVRFIKMRKLDAAQYLVSADMPSWLNIEHETNLERWGDDYGGSQETLIRLLKREPIFNALFPQGNMVLAEFSSGSDCRDTLVAIDVAAVAYLKKLKDTSSANALTCEEYQQGSYQRLVIEAPSVASVLGSDKPATNETFSDCDTLLAVVLTGHASTGTLTVSTVSNSHTGEENPSLFSFELKSFILEADGSASFLRSDGALKSLYSDLEPIYSDGTQRDVGYHEVDSED